MGNTFEQEQEPTELVSIATLAEDMVYRLPGADDTEIRRALRSAYRDYCRLSACYTFRRRIELEAKERFYPVPPLVPGAYVDAVTEVRRDGCRLVAPNDYETRTAGGITAVVMHGFIPACDGKDGPREWIEVTAIDQPKHGSEQAPKWFLERHGEAVVAGALARMYGMTGKPWSDPAQMQMESVRWENFLTETRIRTVYSAGGANGGGSLSALDPNALL